MSSSLIAWVIYLKSQLWSLLQSLPSLQCPTPSSAVSYTGTSANEHTQLWFTLKLDRVVHAHVVLSPCFDDANLLPKQTKH